MKTQKRIAIVVSDVDKSLAFEWIARELSSRYQLYFVLLNRGSSRLEDYLKKNGHYCKRITVSGKASYPNAFAKLLLFMLRIRPHAVHAHLLTAQVLSLPAAYFAGVKRRIYTRHTSDYHHKYHPKGVWYDRLSNHFATTIISISEATKSVLLDMEGVPEHKIRTIHHGFDFATFTDVDQVRVDFIKLKWKIENRPVIGVIARHIEWKGIQYIVPAFKRILLEDPDATLLLANAQGPYHERVMEMLAQIPKRNYCIIPFEEDIGALYHCFDVFVHAPVDTLSEAFGQTYVEALAAGVPSIFTLSGVACEFVRDNVHARVVKHRDSEEIYLAIRGLLRDERMRERLVNEGRSFVIKNFHLDRMIENLRKLYE